MWSKLTKSWKTTAAAAIALFGLMGPMLGVPAEIAAKVQGIAVVLGLAAAKDSNVTGGTSGQDGTRDGGK